MKLRPDFQFSQGSLQDYIDCRRRFQLKYIQQVQWPAVETEPVLESERHMRSGARFHRMVHQHKLGIDARHIESSIDNPDLDTWWSNFLQNTISDLPELQHPETVLTTSIGGFRILAKFDLLAISPGERAVIVDWKTSKKLPRHEWLGERMQSRVYPYILVEAGGHLNNGLPIDPEKVEMIYWFSNFPESPIRISYSHQKYEDDRMRLTSLVDEITSLSPELFHRTQNERTCSFCTYRSLCERADEIGFYAARWASVRPKCSAFSWRRLLTR